MCQRQKNIARRHHIVPRLLLKWFAKDDKVWVLDRIKRQSYPMNIGDATVEIDYNTVETNGEIGQDCVEQKVLARIEDEAEPIIQNMLDSLRLPQGDDWNLMANFLAIMYVRGPTLRKAIKRAYQFGAEVLEEYIHSNEETWKATLQMISKKTGINVNMDYEEALRARETFDIHVEIPRTHYVTQMLEIGAFFVPVFAEMTPHLEIVEVFCDSEYVISDCAIVAISKSSSPSPGWRWYRNQDANLFFPLSSSACLVLSYDRFPTVSSVDKRRVALANHLMACNSQRWIISKQQGFVWRREDGTTSTSHEELLEFLGQIPVGPAETSLDKKSLQKGILNKLKERETSE